MNHTWKTSTMGLVLNNDSCVRDDGKYVIEESADSATWPKISYAFFLYKIDRRSGKKKFLGKYLNLEKAKMACPE